MKIKNDPTPEQVERILQSLRDVAARSVQARKEMAEKLLLGNSEASYALDWARDLPRIVYQGWYAEMILGLAEKEYASDLAGAIVQGKSYLVSNLDNWRPQRSSSSMSNLVNDCRYEALKYILQILPR